MEGNLFPTGMKEARVPKVKRREFVRLGAAAGVASFRGWRPGHEQPDLVLRNARLFDGTGAAAWPGDLAIQGERILAIGRVPGTGVEEIDLRDLALAPGFIDIHSHADLALLVNPRAESRVRQGVTLEVVGQDGGSVGPWSEEEYERTREEYKSRFGVDIDFRDVGGFLDRIDRTPVAVNVASMVGQGTVRGLVVGNADRPATQGEIDEMRGLVREALAQGAVGLSSGLEYTPGSFASPGEIATLASEVTASGYPYASHMRNEDDSLLAAVEETLQVGRLAGVPVQISHLKAQGERNWWKCEVVLDLLGKARASGLDVHFDRYPYVAYSTTLANLFPVSARAGGTAQFLRRLRDPSTGPGLEEAARGKVALLGSWDRIQITSTRTDRNAWARGRRLGELASERGEDPFELTVRLLEEEDGGVGMIGFGMSEENTSRTLAHPLAMICSDGGAYAPYGALSGGSPHPRSYGSFPRVLGHYVRERRVMPLESAVHKMTGMPAAKLHLRDRGLLRPGFFADLVAFDPETVNDDATFAEPHRYPRGIPLVVVNGVVTLRDGEQTGRLAGRSVRGG